MWVELSGFAPFTVQALELNQSAFGRQMEEFQMQQRAATRSLQVGDKTNDGVHLGTRQVGLTLCHGIPSDETRLSHGAVERNSHIADGSGGFPLLREKRCMMQQALILGCFVCVIVVERNRDEGAVWK